MDYLELSELVSVMRGKLNILDEVSKHVTLRADGKLYVGRCPFHDDADESLIVNPIAEKFYCRTCHASGDVLKFIALAEKISLMDAIKRQATALKTNLDSWQKSFEEKERDRKRRELIEINDYARDFYYEYLMTTDEGDACRKYLETRGITNDAIEKFQLGLAPSAERRLATFLYDYGFTFGMMLQAGLIEHVGNEIIDKFRACITFPLADSSGHTAAIIGRAIDFEKKTFYEMDGAPDKYVYPTENSIFNKSNVLFGLSAAKISIVRTRSVIIVEDCLDAIVLHCAGIENVVAALDKSLTADQTETLAVYAKEFIFCVKHGDELQLDEHAFKIVAPEDGGVFVAALPESPVKFLEVIGKENFLRRLQNKIPFDDYEFRKVTFSEQEITHQYVLKDSSPITLPPLVEEAGEAILRRIWHDFDLLEYTLAVVSKEIFTEYHQEFLEYLTICAEENKRPSKVSARIFFGDETDEEFLEELESADVSNEKEKEIFEDAIKYLSREYHRINVTRSAVSVAEDRARSTDKIEKLRKYFEESDNND